MKQKILFFDIDGTLIGRSMTLKESTLEALQRAKDKGYVLFICTGRALTSIYQSIKELAFDGYITSAGSMIYIGQKPVFEHYLDKKIVKKIIDLFQEHHILFTLETKHALYQVEGIHDFFSRRHEEEAESNQELKRMKEIRRNFPTTRKFQDYNLEIPVSKVTFVCEHKEDFYRIQHHFKDQFNIVIFSEEDKSYCNGELIIKSCTKGHALQYVCAHYGIAVENSIAFGDSMNDYEMLEAAGTSVVYEEANQSLKALGDYYFKDPDQDGILEVMQEMKLI